MTETTSHSSREKLWTPANIVTLLRICGVPVFVIALISPWPAWIPEWTNAADWKEWVAAGIFIILAATDGLDGYLARSRGEITNFGKFMDPLADKILVAAALLALIELNVLPSWVALVILCREFIISGIRMVAASQGVVIAASWYGKAKTVFQIIALVLFIIKDSHTLSNFSEMLSDKLYLVSWGVMAIALILTIISMLDYFVKAKHLLGFDSKGAKRRFFKGKKDGYSQKDEEVFCSLPLWSELVEQAKGVLEASREQGKTLGTAESCTGGMICTALTAVPGSSDVVQGSIVSYSNEVKHTELGVSRKTLETYGAVSQETALEMARGAREALGADIAISVTGLAGPGGDSEKKPIGTVWIGFSSETEEITQQFLFEGDRAAIRMQTASQALDIVSKWGLGM